MGLAADVQFLATHSTDSLCFVEYMPQPHVTDILANNPFHLNDTGSLTIPRGPGLGIALDWHRAKENTFPFSGMITL